MCVFFSHKMLMFSRYILQRQRQHNIYSIKIIQTHMNNSGSLCNDVGNVISYVKHDLVIHQAKDIIFACRIFSIFITVGSVHRYRITHFGYPSTPSQQAKQSCSAPAQILDRASNIPSTVPNPLIFHE